MEAAYLHYQGSSINWSTNQAFKQKRPGSQRAIMAQHAHSGFLMWNRDDENPDIPRDHVKKTKHSKSSSSGRRQRGEDPDDDVSEVTCDTTFRDSRSIVHHLAVGDQVSWGEQMALLKLELANCKADCDRAQWKFGQVLEKKQHSDRKITTLEKENRDLKIALRSVEKNYLVLSMNTTTSCPPPIVHDTGGSDGQSVTTAGSVGHNTNPYRTIHEDDEEESDTDDDCVSLNWRQTYHYDHHDDHHDDVSIDHGSLARPQHLSSSSAPIVDMTSISHQSGTSFSSELGVLEEFQDITMDESQGEAPSITMLYPDDDPFSTLNPSDSDDEEDVPKASFWWGWHGKLKS